MSTCGLRDADKCILNADPCADGSDKEKGCSLHTKEPAAKVQEAKEPPKRKRPARRG